MGELDPSDVLGAWLQGRLKSDAALAPLVSGVWPDDLPANAAYPAIVWSFVTGDEAEAAGESLGVALYVQVKTVEVAAADAVAKANARAARQRINALLGAVRDVTADGVRVVCRAAGLVNVLEPSEGYGAFRHRGRRFRIFLSAN